MPFKTKNSSGVVSISTTDTVALAVDDETKICIDAANIYNSGVQDAVIGVFISNDETSANGDIIEEITIQPSEQLDLNSLVGQAYTEGKRIIVTADFVGVNLSITYGLFTGDDV